VRLSSIGPVLLALAVFVVGWKATVIVGGYPPFILPPPESVAIRFVEAWADGIIAPHAGATLVEIALGFAVGGGLALAAAFDWRVIASDAFVSLPEIALGIPLTWGTLPRLVNLVGPARAKRLAILCERIPAAEALAMGLVDYVAPPGKAHATARAVAKQVLSMPRNSVRMTKESVNAYASIGAHAASHMAHDQVQLAAASAEAKAARDAFAARRRKTASPAGSRIRRRR
jgi:enoyl-CoA hydratase/carnithine racemase